MNNTWDTGTGVNVGGTANWKINSSQTNFVVNDTVIFDDTASGTGAVTVIGTSPVSPSSVTFANANRAYTISATIASGTVAVTGGGTVTLNAANTYTGGTTLTSGQLNINVSGTGPTNSAIGTGPLTIAAGTTISNTSGAPVTLVTNNVQNWNGSFTFGGNNALNLGTGAVTMTSSLTVTANGSSANPLTIGGAISDGGFGYSLTKAGTGALALGGASTFSGGTMVNAGILTAQGSTSLGVATAAVNVANGATLQFQGGITIANPLTIIGNGAGGQNGALVNNSGTNSYSGTLTLGGNTTISADGGSLSLSSAGSIGSPNANLILTGAGTGSISGTIDTGTGTLTKNGTGRLGFCERWLKL